MKLNSMLKLVPQFKFRATVSSLLLTSALVVAMPSIATENGDEKHVGYTLSGTYLAARIATIDKNTEAAVDFFRQAMKFDPDNEFLKQSAFLTLVSNGNFEESVELGKQIQSLDSSPPLVSVVLGVDSIRTKSWSNAVKQLSSPTRGDLERLLRGMLKAWTQQGLGNTAEALETIDGLVGPSWFKIFSDYHGGLIAALAGNKQDAMARLKRNVDNRAGGTTAVNTYLRSVEALARLQYRSGFVDDARSTINLGLKTQLSAPALVSLLKKIDDESPVGPLISSIQQGAGEVFYNLGAVLNSEGGKQFALIYLQLANVLDPKSDVGILALADLYDSQSLPERANKLFVKIPDDSPYRRIAKLEMALNLDELDKLDEAKKEMEQLLASNPADLVTSLSYGQMLVRHELYKDAAKIYEAAIAQVTNPQRFHWNLFYRYGIANERAKNWPKAETAFLKSLELYPDQPNVLNYLGYSWVDMNVNLKRGLKMIKRAVELRPNDGYIIDSLGWAYYRLGRFDEAVVELERAVEIRAEDPTINDHLGDAYWRVGRRLEATFQWSHALDLKPEEGEVVKIKLKLENGLPELDNSNSDNPPEVSDESSPVMPDKKS